MVNATRVGIQMMAARHVWGVIYWDQTFRPQVYVVISICSINADALYHNYRVRSSLGNKESKERVKA